MTYRYQATRLFWRHFAALPETDRAVAMRAWQIFRIDPFDARLRPHQIRALSARYGVTVYSVRVLGDLRAVFYLDGDIVKTLDIGSHRLYR